MSDPKCSALNAAMHKQGQSYASIAQKIGKTEQHVEEICKGSSRPTDTEFNAIAQALGIQNVPHTGVHQTA